MENFKNQNDPVKEPDQQRQQEEQQQQHHHQPPPDRHVSTPAPQRPPPLLITSHLSSPPAEDSPLHSSDSSSLSHLSSPSEKEAPPAVVVGGAGDPDGRRRVGTRTSTREGSWGIGKRRRGLLGSCRVFGLLFCLVSFSVLAADKNQGWALDSFHKYKEFRYSMTVNVIGFAYSALQAYDLAYSLVAGKRMVENKHRYLIDFALDQMLAYLLLSSSSSANFRVDDWESYWGKDKFPTMARASLAFSYLAFLAFASSSILSGYTLLAHKSR